MMERWQQLTLREQRIVIALGVVLGIYVLYSFIWQPVQSNLLKTQQTLSRQQELLTWVSQNTARYQQAKKTGKVSSRGSLSSIVNRSARNKGITVTRMQPQAEDIQVWIDEIPFNTLLQWLDQLSSNEGINIKAIDLNTTDKSGVVRIRRLQLGRS
ncbi:MAG: type II secretion system protein M [Alteromonadaceae bacterium]|nr:type II secretion system protein M [Alteromonadaceae bacterium]